MTPERWQSIKRLVNAALDKEAEERTALLQQSCADDFAQRLGAEALLSVTRRLPSAAPAPAQWERLEHIFQAALELPADQRDAFLAEACGDDADLRHEVESLLIYQNAAGGLIQGAIHEAAGLLPHDEKARFTPGTTLNKRYRILGLLGKGGMGEVYRADDLKLGQPVALKFLSEKLSQDKAMLARFHSEVSMAHRVTHPNVCRVHDIGEFITSSGTLQFLSMEYVDGEDLSSLLRRIGRLPADKAVEIANQLCAGLAAAHEAGVLHRDLKPANVMIDGKGRVRITDFGLAGFAEQIKGNEVFAGTPAYMSPEQFAGKEVTTKSDIYALGLVLYEVFTGKRVFEGGSLDELRRMHESSAPTTPSSWVKDLDPLVERVILRCLEKAPAKRLASAKQVADALPGGDPLAAALAMGETPSPEMVAAAGSKTGMKPMYAVACLVVIVACLIALPFLYRRASLFERNPANNSPEILARKSREITAQLGWPEQPFDTAYGIEGQLFDNAEIQLLEKKAKNSDDWDRFANEQRLPYAFWYRESRMYLFPMQAAARVTTQDPPRHQSGMIYLRLNLFGALRYFEAMPDGMDTLATKVVEPDWRIVFTAAGLDFAKFTPTEQVSIPRTGYDTRAAWRGPHPFQPDVQLHIEAAAYRGHLVYFDCFESEMVDIYSARQKRNSPLSTGQNIAATGVTVVMFIVLLAAIWLTRRNLLANRGDRKGAYRLAILVSSCSAIELFSGAPHTPDPSEFFLVMQILSRAMLYGGISLLLYFSLEPYIRRRWPETLIGWQRLLVGGWRDPLVGRDILFGLAVGLSLNAIGLVWIIMSFKYGGTPNRFTAINDIINFRHTIGFLIGSVSSSIYVSAGIFFVIFMTCVLLRREWLAGIILVLAGVAMTIPTSPLSWGIAAIGATVIFAGYFLVARYIGLLALFILNFSEVTYQVQPTTKLSAWYAGNAYFVFGVVLALAIYAFHTALGGQKVFSGKLLEE